MKTVEECNKVKTKEEYVEDMSDLLFCELDDSMDVFKPFNKAFVESQF